MPQPSKIPLAFAASGDKNTIPENTQTTGLASWREGFPAITSAPFSEGGIAPKRADFNGIFNALSQAVMWMQQGGVYAYDVNTDYEAGNVVLDAGGLYVANASNGPSSTVVQPSSDTTGATWKLVRLDLATQSAAGYMSAADKALVDSIPELGTFNKMFFSQTSGSYTAPRTGVYRITLKGGGGGGGAWSNSWQGGGGGEGGLLIFYIKLTKSTSYSYTIGAGGSGGIANPNTAPTAGGATTFNSGAYSVAGGAVGYHLSSGSGGGGGENFTVPSGVTALKLRGAPGQAGCASSASTNAPNGGGMGGGFRVISSGSGHRTGINGGGGQGGGSFTYPNGGAGGAGYILIEYAG